MCSDTKAANIDEKDGDISLYELPIPPTTSADLLAKNVKAQLNNDKKVIIFSTYQSIDVLIKMQKILQKDLDLIICDEAHRTAGYTQEGQSDSVFTKVHSNDYLKAAKRLYMTATPKIYSQSSVAKASQEEMLIYSMDDETCFGKVAYELDFGKALEKNLLSEYKVLITVVNEAEIASAVNSLQGARSSKAAKFAFNTQDKQTGQKKQASISMEFAAQLIATYKSLIKEDVFVINTAGEKVPLDEDIKGAMQTAIAFNSSIANSKNRVEAFGEVIRSYDENTPRAFNLDHIDGAMNQSKKNEKLEWLRGAGEDIRILSNAKCLTEGIDVPRLDSVIFFDARDSVVDIVQAVGRVMRKAEGKKYGYVILPISLPQKDELRYDEILKNDRFRVVWKVLKALRSHDSRLVSEAEIIKKVKVLELSVKGESPAPQILKDLAPLPKSLFSIKDLATNLYSLIPSKLGDREYWSTFAKAAGSIAGILEARISSLVASEPKIKAEFDKFLKTLRKNINSRVSQDGAMAMITQHIITRPIFDTIFENNEFTGKNVVSKSMQKLYEKLRAYQLEDETSKLKNLYDNFFNAAFKNDSERFGIVYTPIEIVDYIIFSVSHALKKHFGKSLNDRNVNILDPFTGTGTFIVRLLQSGLIDTNLRHKYKNEIHANEITLLAYYIANLNIQAAYHAALNEQTSENYETMKGLLFTDTFELGEDKTDPNNLIKDEYFEENEEEIMNQKRKQIDIIIGNPPYSAGQTSANDDNKNTTYPNLFKRIKSTYANLGTATNKNSLYDKLAIRWASDRIKQNGIIGFVTNASFLDANADDGLRSCLESEFSHIYVINLRGNARTAGETRRKEGDGIFGLGSRTPVAITLLIKDANYQKDKATIYYHDIGEYLSRDEKLAILSEFKSIAGTSFRILKPNKYNDWINQRDESFYKFVQIASKDTKFKDGKDIFRVLSQGLKTNRDAWAYNFSKQDLLKNMSSCVDFYNTERENLAKDPQHKLDMNPAKISWSRKIINFCKKNKKLEFDASKAKLCLYRPYSKAWLYYDAYFNEDRYQLEKIFPAPSSAGFARQNLAIALNDKGGGEFGALITNDIFDLHLFNQSVTFPLYYYEKQEANLLNANSGYERKDAIRDWALAEFRRVYKDSQISKEDIFYYIYGLFHSKDYREHYADNLSKMLPRIPYCKDFWGFSHSGRALAALHLNYETQEPNKTAQVRRQGSGGIFASDLSDLKAQDFRVFKMRFAKKGGKPDKTTIEFNHALAIENIPPRAYEYVVNGKSALEWVMERFQVKTDKESGIVNDPNTASEDPRYVLDLILRVIETSLQSVELIDKLPPPEILDLD